MIQDLKSKRQMTLGQRLHYSQAIPKNFPVPPYPSNVVKTTFINSTKGSPRAVLSIVTRDPPQTAFQWYLAALKKDNWLVRTPSAKLTNLMAKGRQFYMMKATKSNQQLDISCVQAPRTANTNIGITFTLKQ